MQLLLNLERRELMERIFFISFVISVTVALVTGISFAIGMKMTKSPNLLVRGFGRIIVVIILLITAMCGFYIFV